MLQHVNVFVQTVNSIQLSSESSSLSLLLIILVSFNSLNPESTFKKRESARRLPITQAGFRVSIKASLKPWDLPPRSPTAEGKKRRENQGSFCQQQQKKTSSRKEFIFIGHTKPTVPQPRISLFHVWVTAVLTGQLLMILFTLTDPLELLISLWLAAHPCSKEKARMQKLNLSAI